MLCILDPLGHTEVNRTQVSSEMEVERAKDACFENKHFTTWYYKCFEKRYSVKVLEFWET